LTVVEGAGSDTIDVNMDGFVDSDTFSGRLSVVFEEKTGLSEADTMEDAATEASRVELLFGELKIMEGVTTEISRVELNSDNLELTRRVELVSEIDSRRVVKSELTRRVEVVFEKDAMPVVVSVTANLVFEIEVSGNIEDITIEISRVELNFDKFELTRRVEVVCAMDERSDVIFVTLDLVFEMDVVDTIEYNAISLQKVMTHWIIIGFDDLDKHKRFSGPLITKLAQVEIPR
jgi:hypothetical protein